MILKSGSDITSSEEQLTKYIVQVIKKLNLFFSITYTDCGNHIHIPLFYENRNHC